MLIQCVIALSESQPTFSNALCRHCPNRSQRFASQFVEKVPRLLYLKHFNVCPSFEHLDALFAVQAEHA